MFGLAVKLYLIWLNWGTVILDQTKALWWDDEREKRIKENSNNGLLKEQVSQRGNYCVSGGLLEESKGVDWWVLILMLEYRTISVSQDAAIRGGAERTKQHVLACHRFITLLWAGKVHLILSNRGWYRKSSPLISPSHDRSTNVKERKKGRKDRQRSLFFCCGNSDECVFPHFQPAFISCLCMHTLCRGRTVAAVVNRSPTIFSHSKVFEAGSSVGSLTPPPNNKMTQKSCHLFRFSTKEWMS